MDIFDFTQRAMRMTDASWARHANPWSVYSRILGGTLVFFAIWSIYWIGWFSLFAIAIAIVWIYVNPRLFAPPKEASSWAAKGVLGERAFLHRKDIPIPRGHLIIGWITTSVSIAFLAISVYGILYRDFWIAFSGWHASMLAKIWFVDRMVWLWDLMKDRHPVYAAWSRADWSASFDQHGSEPIRQSAEQH